MSKVPGQSHFPLYTKSSCCTVEFSCPPGQPILRKSAKAVGEIAFKNAGENAIANSSVTPTDPISHRRANFFCVPGIFSSGTIAPEHIYFQESRVVVQDLSQEECCYPPETLTFGKIGSGIVWLKKGTPRNSSAALIITKIKFSHWI